MSNDLALKNQDDGWRTEAADNSSRVIKGQLLKFADWNWTTGKEGTQVEKGTRLVAVGIAAAWVKWEGGKPAEYRFRDPNRRMPDRAELGDADESKWERDARGEPKDPWQNTRFVYFIDPLSAASFTFSTSSWGGRGAVSDLADQIDRVRYARPGALPVVELQAAEMPTKYGRKSKPFFKVIEWRGGGGGDPALLEDDSDERTDSERALDDEIPF